MEKKSWKATTKPLTFAGKKKTSVYNVNKQTKVLQWSDSKRRPINSFSRPFPPGGHVESQQNKKLCCCTASLEMNSRLGEACRAKTKLFIPLEWPAHGCRVTKVYGGQKRA